MTREDYCSYEVANLLKEKGFDWMCNGYYNKDDEGSEPYFVDGEGADNWNNLAPSVKDLWFSAPTHQMAMKWLREEYNIHIAIDRGIEHYFAVLTKLKPYQDLTMKNDVFDTYEEAVEAALKYCLTVLI